METTDLNSLIEAAQQESAVLQERALHGVKALDELDQISKAAQQKLQQYLAEVRVEVGKTRSAMETLEQAVQADQAQLDAALIESQHQLKSWVPQLGQAAAHDSESTAAFKVALEQALQDIEKDTAGAHDQLAALTAQVHQELAALEKSETAAQQALNGLNNSCQDALIELKQKQQLLVQAYTHLQEAAAAQLKHLDQSHLSVQTRLDAGLKDLENEVASLVKAVQTQLGQNVRTLDSTVTQGASRLGEALDALEKAIQSTAAAAHDAHQQVGKSLQEQLTPGVTSVSQCLYKAASATRLV